MVNVVNRHQKISESRKICTKQTSDCAIKMVTSVPVVPAVDLTPPSPRLTYDG